MLIELIEKWCKISWTAKTNLRQCLSVSSKNILDSTWNFWVLRVSINSEAVINTINTHVSWDTSKAETRETLVMIVRLNNLSYLINCALVLIIVSKIVERRRA